MTRFRTTPQTDNPARLVVSAVTVVTAEEVRGVEAYAHRLLEASHIRGEWFDVTPEEARDAIERAVAAVREGKTVHHLSTGRTAALGIRIKPDVKDAMEAAARDAGISGTAWIEQAIRARLVAEGYLPKSAVRGKKPEGEA